MRKATQKTTPVSLGTKRSCPGCGTKFYDFNKEEVVCPKCDTKVELDGTASPTPKAQERKPAKIMDSDEDSDVVVGGSSEIAEDDGDFESVDDLDDEEDDLVEDIKSDDEQEDDF